MGEYQKRNDKFMGDITFISRFPEDHLLYVKKNELWVIENQSLIIFSKIYRVYNRIV